MIEYGHGGDIYAPEIEGRNLLDFSVNLNPLGLSPKAKALFQELAEECVTYPDPYCRALIHTLAEYEGVAEEAILCGNGAADLIYRIAYGLRPNKVLVPAPTFSEYEEAVIQAGGMVCYHLLQAEDDFSLDKRILADIQKEQPDMVFLCNPNNPTGKLIEKDVLLTVADYCKAQNIYLIIDECFLDMAESGEAYSMRNELENYPNLMVMKAFTKFFAMAGLRLGYLMSADKAVRERIWKAGQPWSVSVAAQRCGVAALQDKEYIRESKRLLPILRRSLYEALLTLPLKVYPGAANYLLFETERTDLEQRLLEKGILIRNCNNYQGLKDGYFRTAVKTEVDNQKLVVALQEIYAIERN